jgi:hypothetical protein
MPEPAMDVMKVHAMSYTFGSMSANIFTGDVHVASHVADVVLHHPVVAKC